MTTRSSMSGALSFPPQEKVIFGPGVVAQLAEAIDRLGKNRALVITGTTIARKTDLLARIRKILGPSLAGVFFPVSQHVPRRDVIAAASLAREAKADILVSLGGSSPVDGAKAAALCLAEGIVSEEQLGFYGMQDPLGMDIRTPAIPHIAITTTLSAGEFTAGFGITDTEAGVKKIYGAAQFIPRVVFLDPEMTLFTPSWLWSSTGMRAVDHAVERLYSTRRQPMTDALCIQALRYFFQNLRRSIEEPQNLDARLSCQTAAWMSAFGFSSVGTGIGHAIGHQLGAHSNVPHGQTSCVMLPHAMEFNLPVAADRLALVAEAAGVHVGDLDTRQAADAGVEAVRCLVRDLGCPTRLREVGVKKSDFPLLAESVIREAPLMQNPRPVREPAEVLEILQKAW